MDDFAVLALLAIAFVCAGPVAFVMAVRQRGRIAGLEARLAATEARLSGLAFAPEAPAPFAPPEPEAAILPPAEVPAAPPAEEPLAPEPPRTSVPPNLAAPPLEEPPPPAAARPGLEERLGTRWTVWVGGLALALGGIFLVRASIEQGLLGPGLRVVLGGFFALALLAAGEVLRRREGAPVGAARLASVPGALTAAGTSAAFASVYAAYALYGFIGPGLAFVLLGAIALLTLFAAALHGPALAGLGLVAALGQPFLIANDTPQFWPLVLYLAFVTLAADALARLRLWRWLALSASVGALLWAVAMSLSTTGPDLAHLLVQLVIAGLFLVVDPHRGTPAAEARVDRFASGILAGFALVAVLIGGAFVGFAPQALFALAAAGLLLSLAVLFPPAAPGASLAQAVGLGILALWPIAREVGAEPPTTLPDALTAGARPEALGTYLAFAAATIGGPALAALWRLWRSGPALPWPVAAWFAGALTVGPLMGLALVYARVANLEKNLSFALLAGALALVFTGLSAWIARAVRPVAAAREEGTEGGAAPVDGLRLTLGAVASAAVAALALGLTFALDRGMLTVAFALAGLGTALVADRVGLPVLRYAVGAIAVLLLARLVWDPTIVGGEPGRTPILNWLLWGYGVPAASMLVAARVLERRAGRDLPVRLVESLGLAFAGFLVLFQIRHLVQGGDPLAPVTNHLEVGLVTAASLIFALVLLRTDRRRPDSVYRIATYAFGAVALGASVSGLVIGANPFFTGEPVQGGPVLNSLVVAYLLPALLAGLLAWQARGVRHPLYARLAAALGLGLWTLFLLLWIRRLFQGPLIAEGLAATQGEQWAYSLGLLATGLALLALGFAQASRTARLVSAGFILATVLKVFIIDLANLEGVLRAFSFMGLGLTLVGIGLAYQKLLVRRPTGV